jgi:hypothetical protein
MIRTIFEEMCRRWHIAEFFKASKSNWTRNLRKELFRISSHTMENF